MILVFVEHGLGNQMFQYAFGLMLAQKAGPENVSFDLSYLPKRIAKRKTHDIEHIFQGSFPRASYHTIHHITGRYPWFYRWSIYDNSDDLEKAPLNKSCRLVKEAAAYRITKESVENVRNINWNNKQNYYVWGFWENPGYFAGYEDIIRKAFQFRHHITLKGRQKYSALFQPNAVSVHIRRGDFLKVSNQSFSRICTRAYYDRAFDIISQKIADPLYVFFSDDPEFVKSEYHDITNKIVIEHNPDYIDLQLMSYCRHHICANSTFSFWGAFLNSQPNEIVVAPKYLYMAAESRRQWVPYPAMRNWTQII